MTKLTQLRRLFTCMSVLVGVTYVAGCDLRATDDKGKAPDIGDLGDLGKDDIEAKVLSVMRKLFPDLSASELSEMSKELDLSEVMALKSELEKIRKDVAEFSADLFKSAQERVSERKKALEPHNDGFPTGLAALGQICTYDDQKKHGQINVSGVFNGKDAVVLQSTQIELKIDGATQPFSLSCMAGGPSVDIVFLIDITGSMSNVIASVRDSVVSFIDLIESSGVRGTASVVTFQDSVGVNRTFQQPAPTNGYERSPFFAPASLSDKDEVEELRAFVNRLEANQGADAPENLAGAVDFARNNIIGYTAAGAPNVIGDKKEDPAGTAAFPKLTGDRQVFVVLTDSTFHGDNQTQANSSLLAPFIPRNAKDILTSLHETGTTVHVSDPSWVDYPLELDDEAVDADYWAIRTGGLGEDVVEGYSLVDLELVVVAEKSGLLDITLDKIISSSCTLEFDAALSASAKVEIALNVNGAQFTSALNVARY